MEKGVVNPRMETSNIEMAYNIIEQKNFGKYKFPIVIFSRQWYTKIARREIPSPRFMWARGIRSVPPLDWKR